MKYFFIPVLLIILFPLPELSGQTTDTSWTPIRREAKPWTRWWWMGSDVDSLNLTYNLETLSRAGIGGVEITPIYGVKGRENHTIDYLSPRWMNMLAFTEAEATRLGMAVDMSNGTGWPFGGPEVTIEEAATKAIFQQYSVKSGQSLSEKIVVKEEKDAPFAYFDKLMAYTTQGEKIDLTEFVSPEGKLNWKAPKGKDYTLIALFVGKTRQQVKRAAPGGQGYVMDHFSKKAVSAYFGKFEKAFAENHAPYPHTFFNDSYEVYNADWTPDLLIEFENRHAYRLQDYFPELLADGKTDPSARVISDYRETIGDLLRENFTQYWTDWAHVHQTTTRNQAHGSPANLIDLYAVVDIPECESYGISDFDIPYLRKDSFLKKNDGDPTVLKYASSAAHITGKPYTSSETFTWLTEHFRTSLSQCKPEIDQLFTSGVNHVYFHGTTYSPQDAPWPGWKFYAAVDMSPTNTLWKDAPAFFDYITRVQSFLQSGTPDNDFLLYLPIYDMWHEQRGDYFLTFPIHGMRERLSEFCEAVEKIQKDGYDLDYISDRFIQSTTVENGWLQTEGGTLYKALVLPSVRLIPLETLGKIRELALQGATIVFLERYPSDVPGLTRLAERREQFASLMKQIPEISLLGYPALLSKFASGKESFSADFGGQLIRRKHPDGFLYFFTMLQNHPIDNWISLSIEAQSAVFFNPMTGKKGKARLRTENGRTEIYMQLQPGESIILKTFSGKNVDTEDWNYYQRTNNIPLTGNWQMRFVESDPSVSEIFDLPALGSWTDLNNDTLKINKGTACYSIRFNLNKIPDKEYRLCLGDVRESAVVRVNGQRAGALFAVPFEMNIGQFLKNGENLLEIEVTNLPANRIADYDRKNIEWRIFHEINFVDITYQDTRFDRWQTVPSGLLGPVSLQESMRFFNPADLTIVGTYYYPEHWDESQWERDLKQIKELGFDFVHYAEFAWAQLEPEEGVYDFAWLDRAVNLAAQNNLKVILCTSTATPPVWLTRNHPEILIENENGTKTDHGARQHPSPSNNFYRDYSLKMIDKLAEHYGNDLRVIGWQLDNEPRPVFDYGKDAEQGFREWLKKQYRTVEALNKAWGTAFWSQIYSDFSQINIPRMSQMFMNSHQILDYRRFATEEMVSFLDEQAKTIRSHAKNQWITTNLIPEYEDGHLRQCKELDFHSYTRYMVFGENYGIGRKGYRLGPVERIAKANDFFRPIDGIYGVMELQPGQVNWGKINPQPLPGAVRLWLWHVFAGGSRFTCTYRYRQPIFGTELYHYGIVGPDGITPTRGGLEYAAFIKEIAQLRKVYQAGVPNPEAYEKRRTAILYNHENTWEMQRNKQTSEWNTERHINKYYDALKHFGAPVDFIDENADFASYPTIIAPAYEMVDTALIQRWQAYAEQGGHLILTCRTGHKTRNGQLFEASFAAPVYPLIGGKIVFYDLLLPQTPDSVLLDGQKYSWVSWGEILSPDKNTEVWANYLGDFYEGSPAIIFHRLGKGTVTYVGVDSQDGRLEQAVLKKNYSLRNIPLLDLPDGVHIEYRDGFGIAVNYSDQKQSLPLPAGTEYVIGGKEIPVAGVAVWKV